MDVERVIARSTRVWTVLYVALIGASIARRRIGVSSPPTAAVNMAVNSTMPLPSRVERLTVVSRLSSGAARR
jgi:hypothetical protein